MFLLTEISSYLVAVKRVPLKFIMYVSNHDIIESDLIS